MCHCSLLFLQHNSPNLYQQSIYFLGRRGLCISKLTTKEFQPRPPSQSSSSIFIPTKPIRLSHLAWQS